MTKKFNLNEDGVLIFNKGNGPNENKFIIALESLKQILIKKAYIPHFGSRKNEESMKTMLYWYGMYKDVKKFFANCIPCNASK